MRGQQAAGVMLSMVVRSYHTNIWSPTLTLTNKLTKQMDTCPLVIEVIPSGYSKGPTTPTLVKNLSSPIKSQNR